MRKQLKANRPVCAKSFGADLGPSTGLIVYGNMQIDGKS
jgi:hypothetical protein